MNEIRINRSLASLILAIAGVVGLIVMIVALLTQGMKFDTVSYVALGVGVLGLVGAFMLSAEQIVASVTGRTGQYTITTIVMTIFFVALIVALYIVIRELQIQPADLTESQKYTLSDETLELLGRLEDDVHVVGFYTTQQAGTQDEADIWLRQYKANSNGHLTYEFIDPDRNPGEARRLGGDNFSPGLLIFMQGDRTAEASTPDERSLTGALVRVQLGEARVLYMLEGHGERSMDGFAGTDISQMKAALERENFEIRTLNLIEEGSVPDDADLVVIADPVSQLLAQEVDAIKAYMEKDGALMVLLEPTSGGGALTSGVQAVAYSPDGDLIATAGGDGTARVWDAANGDEMAVMSGHVSDVVDVAFSTDGALLATAGRDGTVRIWDVATGEQLHLLEGHTASVQAVAFSPDGSLLASASQDQAVILWDATTFEQVGSSLVTQVPLYSVTFSPDGSLVAAGGGRQTDAGTVEGLAYIWDAASGEETADPIRHTEVVYGVAFTPDGSELHSIAFDGTEGTLTVEDGESSIESIYTEQAILAIAFTPEGDKIFAVRSIGEAEEGQRDTVRIWPADGGDEVVLTGHNDVIWSLDVSPDGEHFASASRDGTVIVWSLEDMASTLTLTGHTGVDDRLLSYLLEDWGLVVNHDLVVEGNQLVAQTFDQFTPIAVSDRFDATSPITQPLRDSGQPVFFPGARSISIAEAPPSTVLITELAKTFDGTSWGETDPYAQNATLDGADIMGPVAVAVSAEDQAGGGRLVVVGDTDFASNDAVQYTAFGNQDFFLNASNWLTEVEGLNIRPPAGSAGTFDRPFPQPTLILLTISSLCLLPGVVLVVGVVVWISRRRRSKPRSADERVKEKKD